jgi:hypothetical protein
MTARPFLVRMRTRKPCVRFRRVVLGWYVLFIAVLLWKKVNGKISRKIRMRQERRAPADWGAPSVCWGRRVLLVRLPVFF